VADLLGMERHGMALKMAGPKGRDVVYGGIVLPPGSADPSTGASILASDARRPTARRGSRRGEPPTDLEAAVQCQPDR
jgi:hypothetical protein